MQKREKLIKAGFSVAAIGLVVALFSIVPGLFGKDDFPWPILLGSFLYLHGAFMVYFAARGPEMKRHMIKLRFVRLGFVLVFAILVWRIFAP